MLIYIKRLVKLLIVALASLLFLQYLEGNTKLRFTQDVSQVSMDKVLDALDRAERLVMPNETFTLVITSPGGAVSAFKTFVHRIKGSDLVLNTRVHTYAASAGAMMFILGKDRVMVEGSKILFHYARYIVLGTHITELDLTDILEGRLVTEDIIGILGDTDIEEIKRLRDKLRSSNRMMRALASSVLGNKITNQILRLDRDVTLTAKEAKELGVATKLEKLNMIK